MLFSDQHTRSKNAGPDNESTQTCPKVCFCVIFVMPRHFFQLQSTTFGLSVGIVCCSFTVKLPSYIISFIHRSPFSQLLDNSYSCSRIDKLCSLNEIVKVSTCEFKFILEGGISLGKLGIFELFQLAYKSYECLFSCVFNSVSNSYIFLG